MSSELAPINVILRGEQSGGQIAVMDNAVGTGFPRPPLRHRRFKETFDVLEGEFNFQLDDELFTTESSAWITGVTLDVAGARSRSEAVPEKQRKASLTVSTSATGGEK